MASAGPDAAPVLSVQSSVWASTSITRSLGRGNNPNLVDKDWQLTLSQEGAEQLLSSVFEPGLVSSINLDIVPKTFQNQPG